MYKYLRPSADSSTRALRALGRNDEAMGGWDKAGGGCEAPASRPSLFKKRRHVERSMRKHAKSRHLLTCALAVTKTENGGRRCV
jgi:hypothetical protein